MIHSNYTGQQGSYNDRTMLASIARQAMIERGLEPDLPPAAKQQLNGIFTPAHTTDNLHDLRHLLWASIDNDDSRDLDQLTVAESLSGNRVRIRVAVADVDALVHKGSSIDSHALHNTTSVYTPAVIFPMLPEKLSTDLTSLNEDTDRLAIVTDMVFDTEGVLVSSELYRAQVRNRAKLAYHSVGAWLENEGPMPPKVLAVPGLAENLHLQYRVALQLTELRHAHGSLTLETKEANATFDGDAVAALDIDHGNQATQLIEEFMIAANGVVASYLTAKNFPSLRRVLRSPERWNRIVKLAADFHETLPDYPDAQSLEAFLLRRRKSDPDNFADLSLSVVKLIGRGEYVLMVPGSTSPEHFGLAVKDYTHSTAPNRRYPDLITQRLVKAALAGSRVPYTTDELWELATHCTRREEDADKVERRVRKSAAALLLSGRMGDMFDALVTGASIRGTWVRIFQPPVEGRLEEGYQGLDVGDHLRVRLVSTDVERGFIDFVRV